MTGEPWPAQWTIKCKWLEFSRVAKANFDTWDPPSSPPELTSRLTMLLCSRSSWKISWMSEFWLRQDKICRLKRSQNRVFFGVLEEPKAGLRCLSGSRIGAIFVFVQAFVSTHLDCYQLWIKKSKIRKLFMCYVIVQQRNRKIKLGRQNFQMFPINAQKIIFVWMMTCNDSWSRTNVKSW